MVQAEVRLDEEAQRYLVESALAKPNPSFIEVQLLGQIDPDLSVTIGFIDTYLSQTASSDTDVSLAFMEKLFDIATYACIHAKETDVDMLNNILACAERHKSGMDNSGKKRLNNRVFLLFDKVGVWRQDMMGDKKFPWAAAVERMVFEPVDLWAGRCTSRVRILSRAPRSLVRRMLAGHAAEGGNFLMTLWEDTSLLERDSLFYSEVINLVRLLPDENQAVAQSALWWARDVVSGALFQWLRGEDGSNRTPWRILRRIEAVARKKWESLSDEERGTFLSAGLLVILRELYPEFLADEEHPQSNPISPNFPRLQELLSAIVAATSDETKVALAKDLKLFVRKYPGMNLGIIAQWFPDVAAEVEAWRKFPGLTKTFVTIFKQS